MAVRQVFEDMRVPYERVELGYVVLKETLDEGALEVLESGLYDLGFELVKTREMKLVEAIKNLLVGIVSSEEAAFPANLSTLISERVGGDYTRLSNLFSSVEGVTIEHYFINLKIEKVKEWLSYGDYNISESAWKLGYSSVQHVSSQFKKVTGMTPSQYKKLTHKPRKTLDNV
jgi:AraC family transcriptional regulator